MSDEHSTVDIAWNRLLRAEHDVQEARNWAPSRLNAAAKKRTAAAQALHRMGVDISAMRRERIDAAIAIMADMLATEGVRASVRRAGTRILVESPDLIGQDDVPLDGFIAWAEGRGIGWHGSSWHGRKGEPASVLTFELEPTGQAGFSFGVEERPKETDEERKLSEASKQAEVDIGRAAIGLAVPRPTYQPTSAEKMDATVAAMVWAWGIGGKGPSLCDWEEWSG